MTLTAVVITKNEEERIRRCLDSLKGWVDEIIVVDDMSTDRTAPIARDEYGARVIQNPLNNDFAAQRNLGMRAAKCEWIMEMDADEVVPPESAKKIKAALSAESALEYNGFEIKRINCVFDRPLQYPGRCEGVRIARKGKGESRGTVHENLFIDGKIGTIDACVYHYNLPSVRHVIERNNFYTEEESVRYLEEHGTLRYSDVRKKIILGTMKQFYKHYRKHKGYKDGAHGLIRAALHTIRYTLYWLKILERAVKENKLRD